MVAEATEADSQAGLANPGTRQPSLMPADAEAATDGSLTTGPMVTGSRVESPLRAAGTAASPSAPLSSLPADSLAENASLGPPACSLANAHGNYVPAKDSRPAYQSPSNTHPAQPEDGRAVRSTAEEQTRVHLPRAGAWEVPAGRPSLAVSHAQQPPLQTSGGRDWSAGVGHAPSSQGSAPQLAAEGAPVPPVQRDAATSPVRNVLPPSDFADRRGMCCLTHGTCKGRSSAGCKWARQGCALHAASSVRRAQRAHCLADA